MKKRKQTTIRVDAELLQKAQDLGLNVSKVCENAIRRSVEALESLSIKTEHNGGVYIPRTESSHGSQMPRWPSWLGHRLGKAEVAGSNPARGFALSLLEKENLH